MIPIMSKKASKEQTSSCSNRLLRYDELYNSVMKLFNNKYHLRTMFRALSGRQNFSFVLEQNRDYENNGADK